MSFHINQLFILLGLYFLDQLCPKYILKCAVKCDTALVYSVFDLIIIALMKALFSNREV